MRIAFATPYYFPELKFGGPPQKIHALARGLSDQRHRVTVLTFDHNDPRSTAAREIDGVSVQYLPWAGRGLRQFPTHRAVLTNAIAKTDLVHCYGLYTPLVAVAARAAKRVRVPVVQEPLGMYPPRARNRLAKRIYNEVISRRMFNDAAAVVAASEAEANDLRTFVPHATIVHRRNGIDVDAFATLPSPDKLREGWKIRHDDKVVLFVGRLSPIKNLETLVLAFAKATRGTIAEGGLRNAERAKLILVGPGEAAYEARLRELVSREGLTQSVVFAGPLYEEQQKAALALADLFVLPSLNESFGNAAAEAVAANVPVLLTETCGIAPMIHSRAGIAVRLGVEPLVEGLKLMLMPEVRDQMTAGREEVKRELSWEEPIRQQIALYHKVIKENAERLKTKSWKARNLKG